MPTKISGLIMKAKNNRIFKLVEIPLEKLFCRLKKRNLGLKKTDVYFDQRTGKFYAKIGKRKYSYVEL